MKILLLIVIGTFIFILSALRKSATELKTVHKETENCKDLILGIYQKQGKADGLRNMNINDAARIAAASGRAMTRETYLKEKMRIEPTNGPECCIISVPGAKVGPRWNPQLEDLTANDWLIVD